MDKRFTARKAARAATVALAISMLAFTGCKTTTKEEAPPPPTPSSEFDQGETPAPVKDVAPAEIGELENVYFDFDKSEIRPEGRQALRSNADKLKGGDARVTIEGHADERGDEEYNLALGERRANAARRYLVNLGVSGSRLRIVSYGESKPAVKGHDEAAWKWNRRNEFRVD
ncbi:MAG: OmpA family protein [Deltaproteobacteria bacterium]|nr:OmpA family protein [Deltaproteobacteria bacterium]MBW2420082.1 OmpA family protein [Deltaproteobacteria bacterium]